MKTQLMKCHKLMTFCFFERAVCFFFIIISVFYFGQSLTSDNPLVHINSGTVITDNSESPYEMTDIHKAANPKITVTGKEHLYIAGGAVYGLQETPTGKIAKKADALPSKKPKAKVKNEISRKKFTKEQPVHSDQKITTQPDRNNLYTASLSGQTVFVVPGSHYQNFIFYHFIRYIPVLQQYDEYTNPNYHYHYSVFLKNIIDGGGIRPPPFHC